MSCNSSEALFEAYLDNTLAPAKRARLLAHLRGCGRCTGVLEELRVVDALLVSPRTIELPENFTFATMAEVRALPRPHVSRAPVVAYLVSYLVAAWLLIGAAFLLEGSAMRAAFAAVIGACTQLVHTVGAMAHAGAGLAGQLSSLGTVLGGAIVLDVMLVVALVVGARVMRPLADRLRS